MSNNVIVISILNPKFSTWYYRIFKCFMIRMCQSWLGPLLMGNWDSRNTYSSRLSRQVFPVENDQNYDWHHLFRLIINKLHNIRFYSVRIGWGEDRGYSPKPPVHECYIICNICRNMIYDLSGHSGFIERCFRVACRGGSQLESVCHAAWLMPRGK